MDVSLSLALVVLAVLLGSMISLRAATVHKSLLQIFSEARCRVFTPAILTTLSTSAGSNAVVSFWLSKIRSGTLEQIARIRQAGVEERGIMD